MVISLCVVILTTVCRRTVRSNFRICLIVGSGGERFQRRCREYPAFTKSVNFIWLPHWSKLQLVDHAMYHLNGEQALHLSL